MKSIMTADEIEQLQLADARIGAIADAVPAGLTEDQKRAFRYATGAGGKLRASTGVPGAGKTRLINADAYRAEGYTVRAVSVANSAVEVLRTEYGRAGAIVQDSRWVKIWPFGGGQSAHDLAVWWGAISARFGRLVGGNQRTISPFGGGNQREIWPFGGGNQRTIWLFGRPGHHPGAANAVLGLSLAPLSAVWPLRALEPGLFSSRRQCGWRRARRATRRGEFRF